VHPDPLAAVFSVSVFSLCLIRDALLAGVRSARLRKIPLCFDCSLDNDFGMSREEKILEMIRATLREAAAELSGYRVVLFGSRARGQAGTRSDFDIGVLGHEPLPLGVFFRLAECFERLPTLYSIDWVDLQRTSQAFRQSALQQAITLYE
jgi:predicted nucleotidyltransferase